MAEIRWYGHNCFRIRGKEATIVLDPVGRNTGYAMGLQTADIVTISHSHDGHTNTSRIRPEFRVVDGPGEYEMHDVFITGVRTYHDTVKGAERGYNTVFIVELEGMRFAHLGDLGHPLTETQAEELDNVDVLMVPVGGGTALSASVAADLVAQVQPKAVIPMQYRTEIGDQELEDPSEFLKLVGAAEVQPVEKLTLKPSDLNDTTQVFLLIPDSDIAKR
jgi:L-ascorbate metabolism protein UlaG (beta-lactamase superfamily)